MLPHLDAAYGYARWLTRDPSDAQDLAQEAMLRALRYFHAFRGEAARPWLLRIVRNTWIDFGRANKMEKLPLEVLETAPDVPDPEQSAWPATSGGRSRRRSPPCRPKRARSWWLREIEDLSTSTSQWCSICRSHRHSRLARAAREAGSRAEGRLGRRDHGLPDV